jgi:hypothetical protein
MHKRAQGQEVEFHEIEIAFFHEIEFMRSNFFPFFMRSKFVLMIRSPDQPFFCEIKIQIKALLGNFDLMIDLLVASMIMRSKFKKALLGILIS